MHQAAQVLSSCPEAKQWGTVLVARWEMNRQTEETNWSKTFEMHEKQPQINHVKKSDVKKYCTKKIFTQNVIKVKIHRIKIQKETFT